MVRVPKKAHIVPDNCFFGVGAHIIYIFEGLIKACGANRSIGITSAKDKTEDLIRSCSSCILKKPFGCDSSGGKKGEKVLEIGAIGAVCCVGTGGATHYVQRIKSIWRMYVEKNNEEESIEKYSNALHRKKKIESCKNSKMRLNLDLRYEI